MKHRIFRGTAVNNLRTYMSEAMGKEVVTSPDMFCLCTMERGRITGVGVFEAGTIGRIYEINVPNKYKYKGIEQEILMAICGTLSEVGSSGVTMKIHEEDGFAFWQPILERNAFSSGRKAAFYHFLLVDAYASPLIKRAKCPPGIMPLSDAAEWQRIEYDKRLRERNQFAHLTDNKIADHLSAVYLQENRIGGCFLVSEFDGLVTADGTEEKGIYVEYASTRGVTDPLALIEMIRYSMERVWKSHVPDEHGYILSMDQTTEGIFKKLFPNGKVRGRVEEFTLLFDGEEPSTVPRMQ